MEDKQRQEREKDPEQKRNRGLQEEALEKVKGEGEGRRRGKVVTEVKWRKEVEEGREGRKRMENLKEESGRRKRS